MRKITALILALLMVLSLATTSFASDSYQELKTLNLVPNEITESNQNEYMTREAFVMALTQHTNEVWNDKNNIIKIKEFK
jgi:hypothetical protein